MEDKYVRVIYESNPIGKYKIVLRLTTFDMEAYKRDKEIKNKIESKVFDIPINTPLEIIEERLNEYVKQYYGYELDKFRRFAEGEKLKSKHVLVDFLERTPKIIKNVTNSENIYCEIIQGNVVNCDNVHCKEIRGNIVNSEIIKE